MKAYNLEQALANPEAITELYLHGMQYETLPPEVFVCTRLEVLDISGNLLGELPDELQLLSFLRVLIARKNQLKKLPVWFQYFRQLESVDLEDNHFSTFPEELLELNHLQKLNLGRNRLSELPEGVAAFRKLTWFSADYNRLTYFPKGVSSWRSLVYCSVKYNRLETLPLGVSQWTLLQRFDARNNRLVELPIGIQEWVSMQRLQLRRNKLSVLNVDLGSWRNLQVVDLGHNQLSRIEFSTKLPFLRNVRVNNNELTTVPKALLDSLYLEQLWLGGNRIADLPEGEWGCRNLSALELSDNALVVFPISSLKACKQLRLLYARGNDWRQFPVELATKRYLKRVQGFNAFLPAGFWTRFHKVVSERKEPVTNRLELVELVLGRPKSVEFLLAQLSFPMKQVRTAAAKMLVQSSIDQNGIPSPAADVSLYLAGTFPDSKGAIREDLEAKGWKVVSTEVESATHLVLGDRIPKSLINELIRFRLVDMDDLFS